MTGRREEPLETDHAVLHRSLHCDGVNAEYTFSAEGVSYSHFPPSPAALAGQGLAVSKAKPTDTVSGFVRGDHYDQTVSITVPIAPRFLTIVLPCHGQD